MRTSVASGSGANEDNVVNYPEFSNTPLDPVISPSILWRGGAVDEPSVLDAGEPLLLTSGRAALAHALQHAGIGPSDQVLLPAYHCRAMLEPVHWTGAEPVFYRSEKDLSVCMDDLESKAGGRTRCLIVVHYFGFPQNMQVLQAFCERHSITLIEDCAHSFFGTYEGSSLGSFGDYSIASLVKFFPLFDGGCLIIKGKTPSATLHSAGLIFQLKSLINVVEYGLRYRRFGWGNALVGVPFLLKDIVWKSVKRLSGEKSTALVAEPKSTSTSFDEEWKDIRLSKISNLIMHRSRFSDNVERRRKNYRRFHNAFKDRAGCRPLFPNMPDNVVPYVFPLYIDKPHELFPILKHRGVALYRWEDIIDGHCDIASHYKHHLLQIPCHQSLTDNEMGWVIETVTQTLAKGAEAGQS